MARAPRRPKPAGNLLRTLAFWSVGATVRDVERKRKVTFIVRAGTEETIIGYSMAGLSQAKLSPSREDILDLASGDRLGPRSVAVFDDGLNYPGRDAHEFRTFLLEHRSTFEHLAGIRSPEQVGLRSTGR